MLAHARDQHDAAAARIAPWMVFTHCLVTGGRIFLVARFADGLGNGVAPLYHVVSSRLGDGHNAI